MSFEFAMKCLIQFSERCIKILESSKRFDSPLWYSVLHFVALICTTDSTHQLKSAERGSGLLVAMHQKSNDTGIQHIWLE